MSMEFRSDLKSMLLSHYHLRICDHKCELYHRQGDEGKFAPVPVFQQGIDVLGIPIGSDQFVSSRCIEIARSGSNLCTKLPELEDPQAAMLLLQHCHTPRLNYPASAVPPWVVWVKMHSSMTV